MSEIKTLERPETERPEIELEESERQPCEVWTRVMGYHRPVSSFNKGKQGEFHERLYFSEARAFAHALAPRRP